MGQWHRRDQVVGTRPQAEYHRQSQWRHHPTTTHDPECSTAATQMVHRVNSIIKGQRKVRMTSLGDKALLNAPIVRQGPTTMPHHGAPSPLESSMVRTRRTTRAAPIHCIPPSLPPNPPILTPTPIPTPTRTHGQLHLTT